ncbi:flagellar assembly protein FliW [Cohnella nanjingensis]|uniref:Flagellar assembly factor FliW n=1 Tax=Cohnella nanjingensis TaxID=1387779 RepID=A0A7X0RPX5_9BACL|nr:flagellar assembly protein FliW [Cohnella nanjingensis]MBB6671519.1 flagellar assembly protein FliW [Cohnella nanjingensis]
MLASLFGKPISTKGTILGFSELDAFILVPVDESNTDSPFAYLQSATEPEIGFLVADPFAFYRDYELRLTEQDKAALATENPREVAVLSIVTIANPFNQSTINRLAPLVVHVDKLVGIQIVLPPESAYTTRDPLFGAPSPEGREPAC